MISRSPLQATVFVIGLFAASLFGGAWAGNLASDRVRGPYEDLELFARVLSIIEHDYVEEKTSGQLVESAIRGIVDELDPHSTWMSPEQYRQLLEDTRGQYEGIGVEVKIVEAGILISRVLNNSPAAASGLLVQDVITAINNETSIGLSLKESSKLLTGPKGTEVALTIHRQGQEQPLIVRVTRDNVETPAISPSKMPNNIAYIRLIQFQKGSADEVKHALIALQSDGFDKGLILDLRDNPGGLLEESIDLADLFLRDGVIVSTKSRVEGETVYTATNDAKTFDTPIVILVNGMSASASEIVAGALQDRQRAHLIGTSTYGKGSVQTLYENTDQSALKLTIGKYFTPSGAPVAPREGRVPDEFVPMTTSLSNKKRLALAIRNLESVPETQKSEMLTLLQELTETSDPSSIPWTSLMTDRLAQDPQLARALAWFKK